MKVLIGNDIRVKVQLSFNGVPANILSAKAMFVNKTMKDKLVKEYQKKNRFIGRFPIEPFVNEFEPNEYNINSCGMYPKYKAYVVNRYNGFGVRPNWKNCAPIKEVDASEYCSKISFTTDNKTIIATFPGVAQRYVGVYDMIVVARVLDNNYECNSRTVTARLNNVFELVEDPDEAVDNPVQINIIDSEDTPTVQDVYVINGSYNDGNIRLSRNDSETVDINISEITSWYEDLEDQENG